MAAGAVEVTGDAALGLDVSRYVRATTFHGLGQAFLASTSLADALERTARLSTLVYVSAVTTAEPTAEGFAFTICWKPGAQAPAPEGVDAVVGAIVRSARFMLERDVNPLLIRFERPAPPVDALRRFDRLFRCPLSFGHHQTELVYDADVAQRRVPTAHREVAQQSESAVAAYLARISTGSLVDRVRRVLADELPHGEPGVAVVARTLGMSARTLQRQLEEAGHDLPRRAQRPAPRDGPGLPARRPAHHRRGDLPAGLQRDRRLLPRLQALDGRRPLPLHLIATSSGARRAELRSARPEPCRRAGVGRLD